MSDKSHSRGYYGESRIAKLLGGKIVGRSKAVILSSGKVIKIDHQHPVDIVTDIFGIESKSLAHLPKFFTKVMTQCKTNCPKDLIPVAVIRDRTTREVFYIMSEKDFVSLLGKG